MTIIRWNTSLSVGIDEIDEQHMKLLDILNDFNSIVKGETDRSLMGRYFNRIVDYAREHFSAEEVYMQHYNYTHYDKHRSIHIDFIKQLVGFSEKIKRGSVAVIFEIIQFLEEWILNHIRDEDKKFGKFLKSKNME